MPIKTCLFLLSFSLVCTAFSQEISKEDIVKFKIVSITTFDSDKKVKSIDSYTKNGDIISQSCPTINGKIQISKRYFYNDSNQLVAERSYNAVDDLTSEFRYFYNTKNQLVRKEFGWQGGDNYTTFTYEYDAKGNKIEEIYTSKTSINTSIKFKYDDNNLLIQEDKSNALIGQEEKVNYKYSDKMKIIEKKTKVYYFNTTLTVTYLYNSEGKLIKLLEKSSNGVSSTTLYGYDGKGLLISSVWENSLGKIPHKTTYLIKF